MRLSRKEKLSVALLFILLLLPVSGAVADEAFSWPVPHKGNALWLWGETAELVASESAREEFFAFCANPPGASGPIETIYLCAPQDHYYSNPRPLRALIREMHERGLCVHYLDGDPRWALPAQRPFALSRIDRILRFNAGGDPIERFDGIQFDVEPYVLSEFNRPETVQSYKDHMSEVYAKVRREGNGIVFGIAMPTFYNTRADGLMEHLIDNTDYVALMDYKDYAEAIILAAQEEIAYADTVGKKVVIGIELQAPNRVYGVTSSVTFYEEGWAVMKEVMDEVAAAYAGAASYAGIAYHDYKNYLILPEEAQPVVRVDLPEIPCPPVSASIVLDGNLEEWTMMPSTTLERRGDLTYLLTGRSWQGPDDLSCRIWTAWDDDGLYFAFEVTDDILYRANSGMELWRDDHMEVWVDADLDGDFMANRVSEDDFQFLVAPAAGGMPSELVLFQPEAKRGGESAMNLRWETASTEKGYNLEMMIPWSAIGVSDPRSIRGVGLSIEPSDSDSLETEQKTLMSTSGRHRVFGDPTTFRVAPLLDVIPASQ